MGWFSKDKDSRNEEQQQQEEAINSIITEAFIQNYGRKPRKHELEEMKREQQSQGGYIDEQGGDEQDEQSGGHWETRLVQEGFWGAWKERQVWIKD